MSLTKEKGGEIVDLLTGETFDPEVYGKKKTAARRKKVYGKFLRGPIPLEWLRVAGKSRASLAVGVGLWYIAGLVKSETFKVSPARMRELGVERKLLYTGLRQLEAVGLVEADRQPGSSAVVTILEPRPYPK